jgi:hypothetical protein
MLTKILPHKNSISKKEKFYLFTHQLSGYKDLPAIFESAGVFCMLYMLSGAKLYADEMRQAYDLQVAKNRQKINEFEAKQSLTPEERYKKLQKLNDVHARTEKEFKLRSEEADSWVVFFENIAAEVIEFDRLETKESEFARLEEKDMLTVGQTVNRKEKEIGNYFYLLGDIIQKEKIAAKNTSGEVAGKINYKMFLFLYEKGVAFYQEKLDYFFNSTKFTDGVYQGFRVKDIQDFINFSGISVKHLDNLIRDNVLKHGHQLYLEQLVKNGELSILGRNEIINLTVRQQIIYPEEKEQLEKYILDGSASRKRDLYEKIKVFIEMYEKKDFSKIFSSVIIDSIDQSCQNFIKSLAIQNVISIKESAEITANLMVQFKIDQDIKDYILNELQKAKILKKESIKVFNDNLAKRKADRVKSETKEIILKVIGNNLDKDTLNKLAVEIIMRQEAGPVTLKLLDEKFINEEQLRQIKGLRAALQTTYDNNYLQEILNFLIRENDNLVDLHPALNSFIDAYHVVVTKGFVNYVDKLTEKNMANFVRITRNYLLEHNTQRLPLVYGIYYDIFDETFG